MNKGKVNDLIGTIISAAFDTGYYQATMEKMSAELSDEDKREYDRLNREAIGLRQTTRDELLVEINRT